MDPSADLADLYAFVDGEHVVLAATVNPFSPAGGGPNFHRFDDAVLYEFHVDRDGDGEQDVSYQFQFSTSWTKPDTFLYNVGSVSDPANLNLVQTYTATEVRDGAATSLGSGTVAPANVGVQSGGYDGVTAAHVVTSGEYQFFAGPRQDAFFADIGRTFDLLNVAGATDNTLLGFNVHTFAVRVPAAALTRDGLAASADNRHLAVWATTSRRAVTVRRGDGVATAARGEWLQVSRLGNPLVNEVVIPVGDKDRFNAGHPRDDAYFLSYVTDPILPGLLNERLGTSCPNEVDAGLGSPGRDDLVQAFLTGGFDIGTEISGEPGKFHAAFEALRIDLLSPVGWPNGRAVADDVVDTALTAMCASALSDGVDATGLSPLSTFPFLGDPWPGSE